MPSQATRLREIALLFLRLGCTAFGGPAVHIAMMEEEVVRRRGWLTRETFLDLLGATNLIPGPNSTEMAIHIGHQQAGWAGLIVAGLCFIVPASLITLVMAWAYVRPDGGRGFGFTGLHKHSNLADDNFRRTYAERIGADESALRETAVLDPAATVAHDVALLRTAPSISPRVTVSGHVYDVVTGLVETVLSA